MAIWHAAAVAMPVAAKTLKYGHLARGGSYDRGGCDLAATNAAAAGRPRVVSAQFTHNKDEIWACTQRKRCAQGNKGGSKPHHA
jgi:hypothetical protein